MKANCRGIYQLSYHLQSPMIVQKLHEIGAIEVYIVNRGYNPFAGAVLT
jgi:hypothetical protein